MIGVLVAGVPSNAADTARMARIASLTVEVSDHRGLAGATLSAFRRASSWRCISRRSTIARHLTLVDPPAMVRRHVQRRRRSASLAEPIVVGDVDAALRCTRDALGSELG